MALKITLKPDERIFIGSAVITNSQKTKMEMVVHNDVPILRHRDIMTPEKADSPCKIIYLAIQMLYIDPENRSTHLESFFKYCIEVVEAAPSMTPYILEIQQQISEGRYYNALKECAKLIEYEKGILNG